MRKPGGWKQVAFKKIRKQPSSQRPGMSQMHFSSVHGSVQKSNKSESAYKTELFEEITQKLESYGDAIETLQEKSRLMDATLSDVFSGLHWLKQDVEEMRVDPRKSCSVATVNTSGDEEKTVPRTPREATRNAVKRIRTQEIFI